MRIALSLVLAASAALVGAASVGGLSLPPAVDLAAEARADSLAEVAAARAAEAARQAAVDSLLAAYAGFEAPPGVPEADAIAWADATLAEMTLEQKVAQLFIVELGAVRDPDGLARMGVGGFHIHRRTAPQTVRSTTVRLGGRAPVPLFFTADYEWGVGQPSTNFTELPAAMAYGAADREELAEIGGAVTALEARAMGVNVVFAPVADVNNNPANPIINTRSFGEDPARVGELAAAYVRGAQANGVLATLKHFPGHGDTDTDTHVAFAAVAGDWPSLWRTELAPYRTALAARPGFVMSTHLWAQALDADPTPATFSRAALTDVLRDSLGYEGIVTTDAMNMAAVRDRYGPRDRAVLPLLAGADVILNETSPRRSIGYVVAAVRNGSLPASRVDASARRILLAKARLGLHVAPAPSRERLRAMLTEVRGADFADELARAAVTVARPGALPIRPADRVALVQLANFNAGAPMTRIERDLGADARVRVSSGGGGRQRAVSAARGADVAVLAVHLRVRQGRAPLLTTAQRGVVDAVVATGTPVVLVVLGNPYAAALVPQAAGVVVAYDETLRTATAVTDVLRGRHRATGRLPVSVPGLREAGASAQ
ncbi:glycoside hydrolase family 3 protein [Rubrivirga sp. IMCC45206]|uniref:glycoside hydrolase family 3 protein n=1 Tax=Rubrivirga sp. IMCC45206 TaxID=3391614 RepID=UPI00398FD7CB